MDEKKPLYVTIERALHGWLADACRGREVRICDGSGNTVHVATGCEVGTLHAAAADFAATLAAMIESPESPAEVKLAVGALQELGRELEWRLGRKPPQSQG